MKKGDLVKAIVSNPDYKQGTVFYIERIEDVYLILGSLKTHKHAVVANKEDFQLIRRRNMKQPRRFRLLKDSITLKKGAIIEESGHYYRTISGVDLQPGSVTLSVSVMEQPEWFEEVWLITPQYANKEEIKALKLKKVK